MTHPSTARQRGGPGRGFLILAFIVLFVALTFGGGTHGDALSSAVVRLASVPLLAVAIWRLFDGRASPPSPAAMVLLVLIVSVPLLQSLALPPEVWTRLPGRAGLAVDYRSAGVAPPWLPISLTPYETGDAVLGLAPPVAMFLATLSLDAAARRRLMFAIPAFALAAVALGMLQAAGGDLSPLRFYAETNRDSGVGFFANRNHEAALLVVSIALAPLWMTAAPQQARGSKHLGRFLVFAIEIVLIVGVGVTRSRAGVLLAIGALLGGLLVGAGMRRDGSFRGSAIALVTAAVVGSGLVGLFALTRLAERFHTPLDAELRLQALPLIERAAVGYFPFGSGLGSFDQVYRGVEPLAGVSTVFLNHAHNDFLELWLETGAMGLLLLGGFTLWWAWSTFRLFRSARRWKGDGVRATASLVIALLVVHSAVDYPLRTAALAVIFALCCGVLAAGDPGVRPLRRGARAGRPTLGRAVVPVRA